MSYMKKKILYTLIVLLLLIITAGAYIGYNAGQLARRYKPEIENMLSQTLSSKVEISDIDVKLIPNLRLVLDQLSIKRPNRSGEGLKLNNATLNVKLLPILKGQLVIEELALNSPSIDILKTASGIEIVGIGSKTEEKQATKEVKNNLASTKSQVSDDLTSKASLNLNAFKINSAKIKLLDQTNNTTLTIEPLNVKSNLELKNNVVKLPELNLNANFNGNFSNISLNGQIKHNGSGTANKSGDFETKGKINLENTNIKIPNLNITNFISEINYKLQNNSASADSNNTKLDINGFPWSTSFQLNFEKTKLLVSPVKLAGADGTLNLDFEHNIANSRFFLKSVLTQFNLEKLLPSILPTIPLTVTGMLQDAKLDLEGAQNNDLLASISGSGYANLDKVTIKNMNIAGMALASVSNLPFMKETLLSKVPEQYKKTFESPDTIVDSLNLNYKIANKKVTLEKLLLKSNLYTISANGTATFDNQVDLKTEISFSTDISNLMVAKTKELKYLLNNTGQLVLPLTITGTLPKIIVTPQLDKLMEATVSNVIKDKASESINKFLGGFLN
jgi:hypothetical protein